MRRVIKCTEPPAFSAWKAKASDAWHPSYGALQSPEKRALHDALLTEQGWVCCYCGRSVALADSHIEHFRPQETHADMALDYGNLHASCIREIAPGTPLHCGHAKGGNFDADKAISPLEENCEQRFIYSAQNGAIHASDPSDKAAAHMIGLLKLDIRLLQGRRAEALKRAFDDEFLQSASDADLIKLAQAYRRPDAAGRLTSFGHVLSRYAEQLLGQPV